MVRSDALRFARVLVIAAAVLVGPPMMWVAGLLPVPWYVAFALPLLLGSWAFLLVVSWALFVALGPFVPGARHDFAARGRKRAKRDED